MMIMGGILMLINEVSKATGLTKKAIAYYTGQGLVTPCILENGYRAYSEQDVAALTKIKLLRQLGIHTGDIKAILSDQTGQALQAVSVKKELELKRDTMKKAVLEKIIRGKPYAEIDAELRAIEKNETITEKLLAAFPGYYGRFICLHFADFLNEPARTETQQAAFDKIIDFLDNIPPFDLPEDLQEYLEEATEHIGTKQISQMNENMKKMAEQPDAFLSAYKEPIEQYLAYKKTDAYKNAPAYRLMEQMKRFHQTSGYYDVFLPAMRQLSPSYRAYCHQLELANEKLLAQYPEIETLDRESP